MQTAIRTMRAAFAGASVFAALCAASQAQAQTGLVTVSGAFTSITPQWADQESTVVSYLPSGPTTLPLVQDQATVLPTGTSNIDYNFFPEDQFTFHNNFAFTPGDPTTVSRGDIFKLGSFTFTNGTWFTFPGPNGTVLNTVSLAFALTTHSAEAALDNHVFSGTMNLVVNANTQGDPYVSADYFYIAERPDLGSVRVFERLIQPAGNPGFTGTADLYGEIGSLIPTSFANPSGGAFLSPSISRDPMVSGVPEPGALSLMAAGMVGLSFMARKTKRRAVHRHA